MSNEFDPVAQAAQVAAEAFAQADAADGVRRFRFEEVYRARRALRLGALFDQTSADGWIARVDGTDQFYQLRRAFLPSTAHVLRADAPRARDLTAIRAGDILQCRWERSARRRDHTDLFLRVVLISDDGLTATALSDEEVAALYHGSLR